MIATHRLVSLACRTESPSPSTTFATYRPPDKSCITFFPDRVGFAHRDPVFGFLLQPANLVPLEDEIHLPQPALGSASDRVAAAIQFDGGGVLDEGLTPKNLAVGCDEE
jgi:hypothetical protein